MTTIVLSKIPEISGKRKGMSRSPSPRAPYSVNRGSNEVPPLRLGKLTLMRQDSFHSNSPRKKTPRKCEDETTKPDLRYRTIRKLPRPKSPRKFMSGISYQDRKVTWKCYVLDILSEKKMTEKQEIAQVICETCEDNIVVEVICFLLNQLNLEDVFLYLEKRGFRAKKSHVRTPDGSPDHSPPVSGKNSPRLSARKLFPVSRVRSGSLSLFRTRSKQRPRLYSFSMSTNTML